MKKLINRSMSFGVINKLYSEGDIEINQSEVIDIITLIRLQFPITIYLHQDFNGKITTLDKKSEIILNSIISFNLDSEELSFREKRTFHLNWLNACILENASFEEIEYVKKTINQFLI